MCPCSCVYFLIYRYTLIFALLWVYYAYYSSVVMGFLISTIINFYNRGESYISIGPHPQTERLNLYELSTSLT